MGENGSFISKEDLELVSAKLDQLIYEPLEKFRKNLKALSYITYLLQKQNSKPVIVGGQAVELYTAGHYSTMDVDLVLSGREEAAKILEALGFVKHPPHSKNWYYEKLNLLLEIPDDILAGSMEKVYEVSMEDGYVVYVIGIEDLIIDRIRAAVHWESQNDQEWALFLLNAQWEEIDFEYLERIVRGDKKEHQLFIELKQKVEQNEKADS